MKKKINNEMSIASKPSSLIGYFLDHENYKRKEQVNVGGKCMVVNVHRNNRGGNRSIRPKVILPEVISPET